MLSRFRKANLFFVLFALWIGILATALLFTTKYQLFALINHHRSILADVVFTIFTELGSGFVLIPIGLYLLLQKKYTSFLDLTIILIVNSLMMSWLKHYFSAPRPLLCYGKELVDTANWITLYQKYSFPSGHTALGFAIAAYFSLQSKKKSIIILCFLIACCIGYSRIYLGEHFAFDVCFGSIFGTATTCIYYLLKESYINNKYRNEVKYLPEFYDTVL